MSDIVQKAMDEFHKLPADRQEVIAAWLLEQIAAEDDDDEAEWEAQVVREALGDALLPDGTIDADKLTARGKIMTLEEFYPEGDVDDESE